MRRTASGLLPLVVLVLGCTKENTPATDSPVAAVQTADAEPSPPPSAPSNIGKLPVLRGLPPDGECRYRKFEGLTAIVREVTYEGDLPPRVIKVSVGLPTRTYLPVNMEATVRQETGVQQYESETVFVIFNADGSILSGNRQYFNSANSATEKQGLLPDDPSRVKDIVSQVLERCKEQ
jgi:hypothetical protein